MTVVTRKSRPTSRIIWIILQCQDCEGRWPIRQKDPYRLHKCPTCGTTGEEVNRSVKITEVE